MYKVYVYSTLFQNAICDAVNSTVLLFLSYKISTYKQTTVME